MSILDINNAFVWFVGEVTNVSDDPLQIGRVQVRAIPFYKDVPADQLPWAQLLQTPQSAAHNEIGLSPTGIEVGSSVIGFFLDGELAQQPIVIGTFAGIGDLPPEAVGTNSIRKTRAPGEPATSYAAHYPYNKVLRTRSGHVIEIDDTEGAERIHIFHREGSYIEFRPDGSVIYKSDENRYDMTVGTKQEYVRDDSLMDVRGMLRIQVNGDAFVHSNHTATVSAIEKIILASPEIEINNATDFTFIAEADETEGFDLGDDMEDVSYQTYEQSIIAAGGEIVANTAVTPAPTNNVPETLVDCADWTVSSPPIVALSTGAYVRGHTIPQSKVWNGFTLTKGDIVCNLGALHTNVVSKVMAQFPGKLRINSGYRNASGRSQHNAGMAVDLQWIGGTTGDPVQSLTVASWIRDNCTFDQCAIEYSANYPNQCWIHVSYVRPGKPFSRTNRKAVYVWDSNGQSMGSGDPRYAQVSNLLIARRRA